MNIRGNSLFIFRRDLRVADNQGLALASRQSRAVVPIFIFDEALLARCEDHGLRTAFLLASLEDLRSQVSEAGGSLRFFRGDPATVVERLLREQDFDVVFVNRDYTPAARRRDRQIKATCERAGVLFKVAADCLMNEPEAVLKSDGKPYVVFTPYYRAALGHGVPAPDHSLPKNLARTRIGDSWETIEKPGLSRRGPPASQQAGRRGARAILAGIAGLAEYEARRDYPALAGTSRLAAHLRFGTCSVREARHAIAEALGEEHPLIRQLYWRDFFTQVAFHHPHVFGHAFRRRYDAIEWRDAPQDFDKWCSGETGFPIVDAGMRELVATGYMHNRARMVTASFLVKNLQIDWRAGERFFARYLVDYDPCVNNGNWQWVASTGCDAQPYFRVFNPWRQQKRFDPDAIYIKRWVPELANRQPRDIHGLENASHGYLPQIVDLKASAAAFSRALSTDRTQIY